MSPYLYVFLGGGVGSAVRFLLSRQLNQALEVEKGPFPLGTLLANLLGTFLIGALTIVAINKGWDSRGHLRELILVGFLGGLTTFSSFTQEAFTLWREERLLAVFLYLAGNLVLGFTLLLLGRLMANGEI